MIRSILAFFFLISVFMAQTSPSPLARHYTEGEKLTYHMKGDNDGWTYELQANGVVKKDADGRLVEEYGWSDFKSSAPMSLSPQSLSFRQTLSLDPAIPPSIPNLSQVQPFLIGPISLSTATSGSPSSRVTSNGREITRTLNLVRQPPGLTAATSSSAKTPSISISRSKRSTPPAKSPRY